MKKITPLLILLAISITLLAQEKKRENTLQIVGRSQMTVRPDVGVLHIQVAHVDQQLNRALKGLNEKTANISEQLRSIGFKDDEIKTTDFTVSTNTIYRKDEYIDSGYVANQSVEVEFKHKKELIERILNTFSKSGTDFKVSFDFKLSDSEKARVQEEIIKHAVLDAKKKAMAVATTASVRLKKMISIDYGFGYNNEGMQQISEIKAIDMAANGRDEELLGFNPQDLVFFDTITITWEFEGA